MCWRAVKQKSNKQTKISLGIHPVWSVFAVRMKKPWVLSYPLSVQRRLIILGGLCWFCHAQAQFSTLFYFLQKELRFNIKALEISCKALHFRKHEKGYKSRPRIFRLMRGFEHKEGISNFCKMCQFEPPPLSIHKMSFYLKNVHVLLAHLSR